MPDAWKDESTLRELYLEDRLSVSDLADELGCSKSTLYHWMDKFGIERRDPWEQRHADEPWRDADTLRDLYHGQGLDIQGVANELGCTYATAQKWMDRLDVERRTAGSYQQGTEPWHDESTLRELYLDERMTMAEIADHFGCSLRAISKWIDHHDIPTREPVRGSASNGPWKDEETLRRLYHHEEQSLEGVAAELGCDCATIHLWFSKHGIERRDLSDAQALRHGTYHTALTDEAQMREWYLEREWTSERIAEEVGVTPATAWQWLTRHGIETRPPASEPLYDHPSERDYVYYGPNWREQRTRRLERDDHQCVICKQDNESHREEHGNGLHVHHIQPLLTFRDGDDYDYEAANRLTNLVTLCHGCHVKWEGIPLRPDC